MKILQWSVFVPPLVVVSLAARSEPVTRAQLLALVKEGVATNELVARVKKDCVGFAMDAQTTLDLAKVVPSDVLQAAIDCQKSPSPRGVPPEAAPATTPTPGPLLPARVRIAAFQDTLEDLGYGMGAPASCIVAVDYSGPVKVLKRGKGRKPDPAFRDAFPGVTVREMPVGPARDGKREGGLELSPGPHSLSLYCDDSWKREDVRVEAEPGVAYRVVVRYRFAGDLKIVGAEPDPSP